MSKVKVKWGFVPVFCVHDTSRTKFMKCYSVDDATSLLPAEATGDIAGSAQL